MKREHNKSGQTISEYLRSKGYQTCEYIESHGEEYIDSGVILSEGDEVTYDFSMLFIHPSYFSGGYITSSQRIYLGYYNSAYGSAVALVGGSGDALHGLGKISENQRAKFKIKFNHNQIVVYKNDIAVESVTKTYYFINRTSYIFCSNDIETATYANTCAKLYRYEIKNKRNFIPVYNIVNNQGALWDSIEDKFYFNQGTGSFTHGADTEI